MDFLSKTFLRFQVPFPGEADPVLPAAPSLQVQVFDDQSLALLLLRAVIVAQLECLHKYFSVCSKTLLSFFAEQEFSFLHVLFRARSKAWLVHSHFAVVPFLVFLRFL